MMARFSSLRYRCRANPRRDTVPLEGFTHLIPFCAGQEIIDSDAGSDHSCV